MPMRILAMPALICLSAIPAGGADIEYTLISRSAGPPRSVVARDGYAYAGVGHQLWVFDIAASKPVLVFECDALPRPVEGIALKDDHAFVIAGTAGLFIYDIATPTAPSLVSMLDTPGFAVDVAVAGETVYVAARRAGLRIIDISSIESPMEIDDVGGGNLPILSVDAFDDEFIATFYPTGFVRSAGGGTRPTIGHPSKRAGEVWNSVVVRDGYAFIAGGSAGLRAWDVSQINDMHEIGFSKKPGPEDAFDVTLSGDLAFVSDRTVSDGDELYRRGGMRIVDISDPAEPTELGSVTGDIWSVAVSGDRAILADYTRGRHRNTGSLDIVDVTDPANPSRMGAFTVPPEIKPPMVANGTDVYTIDTHLRRFDLNDPAHPHFAWSLALPRDTYFRGRLTGLAVAGQRAFVGGGTAGLHIVDLSNPDQPERTTTVNIEAYDVLSDGDRVFASELFGGLSIVDAGDAMLPSVVGTIAGNFSVSDMKVAGDVLYVAPYPGASLIIYDIADPAMPMVLGYYFTGETIHHIDIDGTYLYLAAGDADKRIEVADVSDPTDPQFVSTFDIQYANISDMTLAANSLYFTVPTVPGGGLRVLDVSDPSNPRRQGKYVLRGEFAHGVAVLPDNIVALGGSLGLLVLQATAIAGP